MEKQSLDFKLNIVWRIIALLAILVTVITSTFKIVREYDHNNSATIVNRTLSFSNKKDIKVLFNEVHNIELLIARSYRLK